MCFDSTVLMPLSFYHRWFQPEFEIELCFRTWYEFPEMTLGIRRWGAVCACSYLSNTLSSERELNSLSFFSFFAEAQLTVLSGYHVISQTLPEINEVLGLFL